MNMKQAWTGIRKGLDTAFEKGLEGAAQVAAVVADEAPGLFSQSKTLRDYRLGKPVATCGPGDLWAIYAGTCKKPGAVQKSVSIWILDKKRILETSKQTAKSKAFDLVFEQQKRSCLHMTRLKHPGVVKVIEPLEDSPQQMVLVTEAIFGSVRNVMTHFSAVPGAAADVKAVSMSPLELKMGLVRVMETLSFLHAEAGLAHCGLQSAVIMVTAGGTWKLAGFCFAPAVAGAPAGHYVYSDPYPPMWDELARPSLQYAAPEQVESHQGGPQMGAGRDVTPAADVFSLATVMYELVGPTGQLLPQTHNLNEYRSKVTALGTSQGSADELATLPTQLQGVLRSMLALSPGSRPSVTAVASCSYFQDDVLLRALRFLDGILQRDHAQKVAFVTDLSHFWSQYDDRVLQLLVLPPLIQELRDPLLQPSLVPLVLTMLERATPTHFMSALLPALQPVLEGAQGELLAALVSASGVLASLMTAEAAGKYLVPLYTRALDSEGQPQVQEKCLRMLQGSMSRLDYSLLRAHIMPRVHAVCMRTTAAVVRVNALGLMTCAVPRLDKEEAGAMIDTATQVVSVDRSAATLMNVAQLAAAISTQHGAEVTATRLLPLVCPLLLASSLAPKQFKEVFDVAQGMLDRLQARVLGPGGQAALASTASTASTTSPTTWDTPIKLPSSSTKHRPTALPPAGAGPGTAGEGLWQASAGSTWTSQNVSTPSNSWMGPSAAPTTLHPQAANPVAGGGWVSSGVTDLSLLKNTGSLGLGSTGTGGGTTGSGIGASGRPANGSASLAAWVDAIAPSTGGTASLNGVGAWAAGGSNGHATGIKAAASSGLGDDDMFGGLAVYEGSQAAAPPTASLQGSGFGAAASTRTPSTGMHAGPFSNQPHMPSSSGGMGVGMGSQAPAWGGAGPMGMGMSSHTEGDGLAGFGALAATPSMTSKPSIGAGGSISYNNMPGKPMGMLSSATSSSAPSDPFSSLNSIALSAPVQPHPPYASRGSNVSSTTVSPAKALPALAPPPRASTTVQATTTQAAPVPQAAPTSNNTLDLLW